MNWQILAFVSPSCPRAFLLTSLLFGCVTPVVEEKTVIRFPPANQAREASDFAAESNQGVVAAAHPLASQAGASMLAQGGNAVDAAVAASFVISVVRPQSTGIGGGGFLIYHDAAIGRQKVLDFRERAPKKSSKNMFLDPSGAYKSVKYGGAPVPNPAVNGHLSVGVPGLVKGLLAIHKEQGKLELSTVMAPAIKIAESGFDVYPALERDIKSRQNILVLFPSSKNLFLPGGVPLKAGQKLIQTDLAETLKQISKVGASAFYEGAISKKIIAEMRRGGGLIEASDLRDYRVIERVAVSGHYRGHKVVSMPPPSSGGTHIIEMLNMLEPFDLTKLHPRGAKYLHLLSEVMRRAFSDRAKEMGDSDFVDVPVARLTSKAYAKRLMQNFNEEKASLSKDFESSAASGESPSTTHISVIDKWGNAFASTLTVNYSFGSCVVAEGTGIVLNDEMDDFTTRPGAQNVFGLVTGAKNDVAPGKTPLSSMSPTLVFNKEGQLELVVGSPGGPRIINATLQTIINVIDFKMSLLDAVHATRIHHQWIPDVISHESRSLDPDTRQRLKALGHQLSDIDAIGDVQAAQRLESGRYVGVSDSRGEGKPAVP